MQEQLFEEAGGIDEDPGALERWCADRGVDWIVGVDEAGRGPLAGPVHAGAVGLSTEALGGPWLELLDDSKKLEESARKEAFEEIRRCAPATAVAAASSERIDEVNILEAAREAMREAALEACGQLDEPVDCLFVDGDTPLDVTRRQRTLVRGDARSYAIASASILAKVSRDRRMVEYGREWPAYGFDTNKGYPTEKHRRALAERGPCAIHRRSFSGVESSRD